MTRRRLAVAVALAASAATVMSPVHAAGAQPRGVTRRDSLAEFDFQDADLRVVVGALAEIAGVNLVFAGLPQRTVTIRTSRPINAREARAYLESVARANGLTLVEEGGLLRIASDSAGAPARTMVTQRSTAGAPGGGARVYVYRLRHAKAEVLAGTIADLFGIGRGSAGGRGDAALSEQLRRTRIAPYDPAAGVVDDPAAAAEERSAGGRGGLPSGLAGPVQIVPDQTTNALLIRAAPSDYETLRAAIEQLDVRPLQVLIEVLIAEVRRNRQDVAGLRVEVPNNRVGSNVGETVTRVGGSMTGVSVTDLVVRVLNIGNVNANVVLGALSSTGDVSILSRPVLLAQNNQEARILVGSQRPFVQVFRSLPTDNAARDQVVQYRDVGTQLTIRPTINPDGYVSLTVLQEVSNATAEVQFGAPVISTREASTQLLVRDGQTAVLGGLIDQQRDRTRTGIPFLKDLPLLGWLFGSTTQTRTVTELFLFLTPRILRTDEDADDATRQLRDRTEQLRRQVRDPVSILPPDTLAPRAVPAAPPGRPPNGSPSAPPPAGTSSPGTPSPGTSSPDVRPPGG